MPHAESTTMTHPKPITTNGDKPNSEFLSHLTSYPIVSDSLQAYRSHPYGQQTLSLAQKAESTFLQPLQPYARGPLSYLHPYLARADSIGSSTLAALDAHFPLLTKDTETVKSTLGGYALAPIVVPLRLGRRGSDYVWQTYGREHRDCGGDKSL
ncbi:MAG: hypothetical protein LQ340_007938, partial [Diploschistes diacapsis]